MRIKKFIDVFIPTTVCNLRCHYCYISLLKNRGTSVARFTHTIQEIAAALSPKRLGGICMFNLCAGGETLLSDDVLPFAKALCENGHFVMIVTNGTVEKRISELETWETELRSHLFFKISLHYQEMRRLELLEKFSENINRIRALGYSFTIEVTPTDELVPYKEELKKYCLDHFGALCHCTIARDDRRKGIDILTKSEAEYIKEWKEFSSDLFEYKLRLYKQKRREYCYAGAWSYYLNIETGELKQCYCGRVIDNIYTDVKRPLKEVPIGRHCSLAYCYNGHAFMAYGCIPYLDNILYLQMRDRVTTDGKNWIVPEMKEAMSCKLINSNREYTKREKVVNEMDLFLYRCLQVLHKVRRR